MAIMNQTKAAPFGAISVYRAFHAVETAKSNLAMWSAKRKTYKQLSVLTTRELEDIGLTRGEVEDLNTGLFRV